MVPADVVLDAAALPLRRGAWVLRLSSATRYATRIRVNGQSCMGAEEFRRLASRALEILVGVGRNAVSWKRGEFKLECLGSIEPPGEKLVTFVKRVAFSFDAESCEVHALDQEGGRSLR